MQVLSLKKEGWTSNAPWQGDCWVHKDASAEHLQAVLQQICVSVEWIQSPAKETDGQVCKYYIQWQLSLHPVNEVLFRHWSMCAWVGGGGEGRRCLYMHLQMYLALHNISNRTKKSMVHVKNMKVKTKLLLVSK